MSFTKPAPTPIRYSTESFPPYRYIPGQAPHPTRDKLGHLYGIVHEPLDFIDPKDWQDNSEYLYGVDLYNQAYWWEAHEAWEAVWHTTKKDSAYGQYLQGLIQISAAFIKWELQAYEGLSRLYKIGLGRLEFTAKDNPHFMGLDLKAFIQTLKNHFAEVILTQNFKLNPLENYPFLILNK